MCGELMGGRVGEGKKWEVNAEEEVAGGMTNIKDV